jgi:hypothetical protein
VKRDRDRDALGLLGALGGVRKTPLARSHSDPLCGAVRERDDGAREPTTFLNSDGHERAFPVDEPLHGREGKAWRRERKPDPCGGVR